MSKRKSSRDQKRRAKLKKRQNKDDKRRSRLQDKARADYLEAWGHLSSDMSVTIDEMGWIPGGKVGSTDAIRKYIMNVVTIMGHMGSTLGEQGDVDLVYCDIDDRHATMRINAYFRSDHELLDKIRRHGWRGVGVNVIIDPNVEPPAPPDPEDDSVDTLPIDPT